MRNIQGGTGKGSVFGEVIVRKEKVNMNMCLILNGYRETAVRIYKYKSIVNDNKEKETTYRSHNLILVLCLNDKFVTAHSKCPKIPPSTPMHFAYRVRRCRVVRLSCSSRFFMRAAASEMRASNSSGVSTFLLKTSLYTQPHKRKSNGVRSVHSKPLFR
jgi:hypothetical protein